MKNKTRLSIILILMAVLIMPIAFASITITSDKQTYAPGEEVTLELNYTNDGLHNVTTKFIHMKVKKFWITAIEQTRDQKKTLMPEQIETGIHKFVLPSFAPPGKYTIAGYAELEDGTLSEEKTIQITGTESLLWKIIKWVFIILILLMIIGIIIRIIRHSKEKKKEKQEEAGEDEEETEQKGAMTKKEKTIPTAIVPPMTAEEKMQEQKRKQELEKAREYLQKPKEKDVLKIEETKENILYEKPKPAKAKEKELVMPIEKKTKEQEQIKIKKQEPIDEPPMPGQEELEGMYKDELK